MYAYCSNTTYSTLRNWRAHLCWSLHVSLIKFRTALQYGKRPRELLLDLTQSTFILTDFVLRHSMSTVDYKAYSFIKAD
jgi:hypothetical protein